MSFKVLSILALVVLVCVLKTTANPVAEKHVAEMDHHPKWEHGSKNHSEAERHNSTRTPHHHDHHDKKMKEEHEAHRHHQKMETADDHEKETGNKTRTKRDTEDKVHEKNFASLPADEEPTILADDVESVIVEAVDPAALGVVELAPVPPPHQWWWRRDDDAVEPIVTAE